MTKFPNSGTMKKNQRKKQNDQIPTFLMFMLKIWTSKFLNDQIPKFRHPEKKSKKITKLPTSYFPYSCSRGKYGSINS